MSLSGSAFVAATVLDTRSRLSNRNFNWRAGKMTHPPEKLPDPWLFDSETLLRELDKCRELVLQIPVHNSETHFAAN